MMIELGGSLVNDHNSYSEEQSKGIEASQSRDESFDQTAEEIVANLMTGQ